VILTVAGTGVRGDGPDGHAASATDLSSPLSVDIDQQGRLYILEGDRVRRVNGDGTVVTVAGSGRAGSAGDGGAATAADLDGPQDIVVDNGGNIYIADSGDNRVRRVDARGVISTVAGTGQRGYAGDGGPAATARLDTPTGLAIGFGGVLLIADSGNNRVRAVGPDGVISTVAGTGDAGYAGDGGLAGSALLNGPRCIAVDAEDNVYVADTLNDRVRRIDAAGVITTVAGSGEPGFAGDGDSATAARLNLASGPLSGAGCLSVDGAGDLLIADALNNRVRQVAVDGIISTLAGNGQAGSAGDGGDATQAQLARPLGVVALPVGGVYIAEADNDRVRLVDQPAGAASRSVANARPTAITT